MNKDSQNSASNKSNKTTISIDITIHKRIDNKIPPRPSPSTIPKSGMGEPCRIAQGS